MIINNKPARFFNPSIKIFVKGIILHCHLKIWQKRTLKIVFDSSDCDFGVWVDRLRIITNDPARPMQTLRVTAVVVN